MRNWDLPKQQLLSAPGVTGDCWRCCIAAILQVPAEEVPHFYDRTQFESAEADAQRWLNARGYALVTTRASFDVPRWHGDDVELPLIVSGPTERSRGMGKLHAVVKVGMKVVYDPHPSEAGLTAEVQQSMIVKLFP